MNVNLNSNIGLPTLESGANNILMAKPSVIIILFVIIMLYMFLFSSLGDSGKEIVTESKKGVNFLGIILVCIFIVLVLINGTSYFFNVDIITRVTNLFTDDPKIDIDVKLDDEVAGELSGKIPRPQFNKQVYHIPGNKYTYEDADSICKAAGNRLATYKEIEEAYNNGGDWCSYGWSENQLALFPTQHDKWNKLQKIEGHKNDCGRPGINGGFIDNKNVQFGVNCYGYKPKISALETDLMNNTPLYPKTQKDIDLENRVNYWKTRISDILIAPFSNNKWDMGLF